MPGLVRKRNMISRRKCVEQPSQKPPGKFFLSVDKEWHICAEAVVELEDFPGLDLPGNNLWRHAQVRFLQTGDFLAIRESELKSITTERGPKDQILTMTLTESQSVIVYTENIIHTQVETVERWVQTHSYLPNKRLLKLVSVLGPPQSPSLTG